MSRTDINECQLGSYSNARCINTQGSYDCECVRGYSGDGLYTCSGIFINTFTASQFEYARLG